MVFLDVSLLAHLSSRHGLRSVGEFLGMNMGSHGVVPCFPVSIDGHRAYSPRVTSNPSQTL